MNKAKLAIETMHTSNGVQYNIVDKDGTIYAIAFDKLYAGEICKSLEKMI